MAILSPTVAADVIPGVKLSDQDVFDPMLGVAKAKGIDHTIALANDFQLRRIEGQRQRRHSLCRRRDDGTEDRHRRRSGEVSQW